ncbi:MAG: hypothetical protein ACJASI_000794 [Glaciecola sp.]|jgi:uncharacterized protein YbaP (TraB family)
MRKNEQNTVCYEFLFSTSTALGSIGCESIFPSDHPPTLRIERMMKRHNIIALIAFLSTSILAPTGALAASVWKVTDGEFTVYFGGTIHILKAENLPLPPQFHAAYAAADKLVFETDIEGAQTPEFQQKMLSQMILTDGTTLQTRLNYKTYTALKMHMDSKGIPIANFHPLKPSMVAITITMMEYQANGFDQDGVDQIFAVKAKADGKPIEWFESIQEQLDFIVNIGGDDDNAMINYTLDEIETLPALIDDMLSSWKDGDVDKLNKTVVEPMEELSPEIYASLIIQRNNNWMPKIMEMLKDKPTELVLVGAAHLAGKDSIFAKLEAKGYKIEKVN